MLYRMTPAQQRTALDALANYLSSQATQAEAAARQLAQQAVDLDAQAAGARINARTYVADARKYKRQAMAVRASQAIGADDPTPTPDPTEPEPVKTPTEPDPTGVAPTAVALIP